MLVTYLGFLSLGEPTTAPPSVRLGLELSASQRAAVANLEASTAWWLPSSSVAAEDLGRGTGRARTTIDAIARLSSAASSYYQIQKGVSEAITPNPPATPPDSNVAEGRIPALSKSAL